MVTEHLSASRRADTQEEEKAPRGRTAVVPFSVENSFNGPMTNKRLREEENRVQEEVRELEKVKREIIEWNEEFLARKGRAPNNKEKEDIKGLYEEFRTRTLKVLTRETRVSEMKVELQPFDVQAFSWLSEMPARPKTEAPKIDKLGDPVGRGEEEKLEGLVGERGPEQE